MRVILCTCPPDTSHGIAQTLISEKLAACVNVLPQLTSYYIWKGKAQRDREDLLIIKTAIECVPALQKRLGDLHSYDTIEFVVLEVDGESSGQDYLAWVRAATS